MNCHDWILSVLSDISEYAAANDMPKLQDMVEEARTAAREEISQINSDRYKAIMKMVLAVEPSTRS